MALMRYIRSKLCRGFPVAVILGLILVYYNSDHLLLLTGHGRTTTYQVGHSVPIYKPPSSHEHTNVMHVYVTNEGRSAANHSISIVQEPAAASAADGEALKDLTRQCNFPLPSMAGYKDFNDGVDKPPGKVPEWKTIDEALAARADANRTIMLSSLDSGYFHMGWNLYVSSLRPLNIKNFLYICSDIDVQKRFRVRGVPCYLLSNTTTSKKDKTISTFMDRNFIAKTHVKTRVILAALKLNYTVLIVDLDIVMFKNPLPYFKCKKCDLQIQHDILRRNSGFYLVRPTPAGIELHQKALDCARKHKNLSNQKCIFSVMSKMGRGLHWTTLTHNQFPCGQVYFEWHKRAWPHQNPCKTCVIMHNNWINTGAAKIYRFKEHLLWYNDINGYYSSTTTKYIAYSNPIETGKSSVVEMEKQALRAAFILGKLLGRVVILPNFSCYGCKYKVCKYNGVVNRCPLNTQFRITSLDAHLGTLYREHTFLCNPMVPSQVKNSVSDSIFIKGPTIKEVPKDATHTFTSRISSLSASDEEFIAWFGEKSKFKNFSVLKFHSLYGIIGNIQKHIGKDFIKKLDAGITRADYRQY